MRLAERAWLIPALQEVLAALPQDVVTPMKSCPPPAVRKTSYIAQAPPLTQRHGTVGGGAPLLRVDIDTGHRLFEYYFGVRGQPERFSGNLGRMLYFSAVVITTLGLGDIIPLTDRARGLVAAEAVLGIVFVGLFINAAASRARRRPPAP